MFLLLLVASTRRAVGLMPDFATRPLPAPVPAQSGIYRHRVTMFGRAALYARASDGVVIEAARPREGETEDDIIVLLADSLVRYERKALSVIPGGATATAAPADDSRPRLVLV